jgi:hypothetical protein
MVTQEGTMQSPSNTPTTSYNDRLAISACDLLACGACPYGRDKGECERVINLQIERIERG